MRNDPLQLADAKLAAVPVAGPVPEMAVLAGAGMPVRAATAERRRCKRFAAASGAFAIVRPASVPVPLIKDMGMGDIAFAVYRLRPERMGQILDIAFGGLRFSYVASGVSGANAPLVLDILSADTGFYLEGLAFETVWDRGVADDIDVEHIPLHHTGLRFEIGDPDRRRKLSLFMRQHTRP